jgi:hypothetical protein
VKQGGYLEKIHQFFQIHQFSHCLGVALVSKHQHKYDEADDDQRTAWLSLFFSHRALRFRANNALRSVGMDRAPQADPPWFQIEAKAVTAVTLKTGRLAADAR